MSDARTIRVAVLDVWGEFPLHAANSTTIDDLKLQALAAAQVVRDPSGYVVKFRGAELRDESLSVAAAGVPDGAALIVLPRRRFAVR